MERLEVDRRSWVIPGDRSSRPMRLPLTVEAAATWFVAVISRGRQASSGAPALLPS